MSAQSTTDRLRALQRDDKWYLSCGDGVIWAPPFPASLHLPGFWDEALVYYHPVSPLFSVALVDTHGNELRMSQVGRTWQPDRLHVEWHVHDKLVLTEQRYALPGGMLVSRWRPSGNDSWEDGDIGSMSLVAYTAQPGEDVTEFSFHDQPPSLCWHRTTHDHKDVEETVEMILAVNADAKSDDIRLAATRSEGSMKVPSWSGTPFWESWHRAGGLEPESRLEGISDSGVVYAALEVPLGVATSNDISFSIRLTAASSTTHPTAYTSAPRYNANDDPSAPWVEFYDSFPSFNCSDPYLTRYYDYRLYGLHLNRLAGGCGNVRHPAIAEGIGYFHVPITYSAQCHMWEMRWSRDPGIARGSLLNFLEHQRDDGSLHGRIYTNHMQGTDFYHANWGDAVLALDAVVNDVDFLERAYDGLSHYAEWLDRTRDREGCGMYDVVNHFETGQEFMSRYQVVDPDSDIRGWCDGLRLKGIDVTVYTYQLKKALAVMARVIEREAEAESWLQQADTIGSAITQSMWDPEVGIFSDVDPRSMSRTGIKAGVCFYPLLTDLLDDAMVESLITHLRDPDEFGTQFPVPSSSLDDPLFHADAKWKGKRHKCPWNGRTWPMVNSHVIEGLLRQWHNGRRSVGDLAGDLLQRFVMMMFHDRDLSRPNCHEHYNPITGHASVYRGIDDYQHSWVNDLLIRGVAGLEPTAHGILIDPLPLAMDHTTLLGATVRGHTVEIHRSGSNITAAVDGVEHSTRVGRPLEVPYD
ncbi:MAG: hypothetical protein JSW51_08820 [Gemmatimonadota bacterium]|nr:MAG: hypothetical protein JSW51_08820 [Gemmatimonadota bacterium]